MFTVTLPARAYLTSGSVAHAPAGLTIRLLLKGESLDSIVDYVRDGDVTFEHDGRIVLAIDSETAEALEDCILDIEETPNSCRLNLREA